MSDEFINSSSESSQRNYADQSIENESPDLDAASELGATPTVPHHRASARRIGALLVDVYGTAVLDRPRQPGPAVIVFQCAQFLVNLLQGNTKQTNLTEAKALLDLLEDVFLSSDSSSVFQPQLWTPAFVGTILELLSAHPSFEGAEDAKRVQAVVRALRSNRRESFTATSSLSAASSDSASRPTDSSKSTMSMSGTNDVIASLVSGIATGMSLEDQVSSILNDVGPACTKSPATLREVLADITRTTGRPLNEANLASLILFFSGKYDAPIGPSATSAGLSSALLSSILSGRGHESSMSHWDLKSVAQVLAEDYARVDWQLVARCWDTASFRMSSVDQFRTLLDLYRAGANTTPPLSAFTFSWTHSEGQISALECIASVPPTIYLVPLNEEELADAAVAPPPGPASQTAPNSQFWSCFEILQRLLRLSDNASLYRRVRDLFVKCLVTCPEVLLCSLVRLQLASSSAAAQGETGVDNPVNVGLQMKTELMRELIPLFFRPNAHHRVQNGPAALRRLYAISPSTVTAACFEAWRGTAGDTPQIRLAGILHIINIARLLPSPSDAVAALLNGAKDAEFSIAIAFVMADNDYLQLKPWLGEKLSAKSTGGTFSVALVSFLRKTYMSAGPRSGGSNPDGSKLTPFVSLENMVVSLQLLQTVDAALLSQTVSGLDRTLQYGNTLGDNIKSLIEACLATFPTLRSAISVPNSNLASSVGASQGSAHAASDDVEEMATAYFQKIYTSEQSIGEVVEMLKRFKTSGNSKENEIFACMVHNLFDEYRFFSKYPDKELRITGILFGALIQEQLVSSITLGIALRYVLEALRKPPSPPGTTTSSGKMFKFGMFALEQFKGRLHEWPQYCSHIVQIPHLKDGYAELVAEIEQEMTKSQSRPGPSSQSASAPLIAADAPGTTAELSSRQLSRTPPVDGFSTPSHTPGTPTSQLELSTPGASSDSKHVVAEFGPKLGRAVTDGVDEEREFEAPPDSMLDKVQFLVNNLAPSNVDQKAQELKDMLDPKYFGWLGHFLVVKRISTQANFHSLYLSFLDNLGDHGKGLVEAIVSSVYHNIGKLLRSPKITTSSSERSYLKNLGIWLGQITLARNRPVLQIMLDCKELLLQGYETGKLIAVAPFLAKTLEGAKSSVIFRPPNPWLMGILGVFRAVYNVKGLKMNIKFEVEVLCKNLGIKLEDIPMRNDILSRRVAPVKERNPDFNIKTVTTPASKPVSTNMGTGGRLVTTPADSQALGIPTGSVATADDASRTTASSDQHDTLIPNLASYVVVNQSVSQVLQSQGATGLSNLTTATVKRWVPVAVDRAIREIIHPVVERSVTIACITTKEIVTKDFAMESDESKMRRAGQLMVANLAGSLALVTCREPLRTSISTQLRQLLTASLGRNDKLGEQEQNILEQCVQICATDNLELGCMLIEKAATEKAVREVDEALSLSLQTRRKHREQTGQPFFDMSIFSNGSRYPAALPEQLRPKPGGLRPEHLQLYESFQRLPRQQQVLGAGPSLSRSLSSGVAAAEESTPLQKQVGGIQFGSETLTALASKLDAAVSALLKSAGSRAAEVKLSMLPPEHQIRMLLSAVKQVMPNVSAGVVTRALSASEQEVVLAFSQGIFKRLYELNLTEPLRLETLVALLERINSFCPKLGKDMGTWVTYAPTNTEPQRRLHRTILLLLVRSQLLSINDLDTFLAARANGGRDPIWVEFSLLFIRTAFMERISSGSDFPKLVDLMTKIADGRSPASPQVVQAYRTPIMRMLEEIRGAGAEHPLTTSASGSVKEFVLEENSSLSMPSLSNLTQASKKVAEATEMFFRKDPPTAKQQITALVDSWIRMQADPMTNEKAMGQFLQVLQQFGVGKVEEQTERFLRLSTIAVVEAVLGSASGTTDGQRPALNYTFIDMHSKLLVLLFRHMNSGSSADQINAQRLGVLNKILGVAVRSMMWHFEKKTASGLSWDQRPWFRLFLNLVIDLNKPDPAFETIRLGVLSVFGAAFHVCQPLVMPGFAFAWLELVSHRHFMPNLMLFPGQKAWNTLHQLLLDHLLFLEPYLRRIELSPPIRKLYEGTLRVILVLLHDFPSFLAGYYMSFCNVIPDTCVQLRNIILSATPKGMNPPDPFTPNLKIDLLPEVSRNPTILSNVLSPIESFRTHLDAFLKDGQRRNFLNGLLPLLCREGSSEVDSSKVGSLVLYVGAHARARQTSTISLSRTPEMDVLQQLMEFDDRGRYTCLNAIANQLRFPSSHTHYFSCVMLFIFSESKNVAVKEQVTRVLLERLIVNRPHPWGLLITFIELIKNQRYGFWTYPFTRCSTEIEKVFESVARSCLSPGSIPQRSTLVGGIGDEQ